MRSTFVRYLWATMIVQGGPAGRFGLQSGLPDIAVYMQRFKEWCGRASGVYSASNYRVVVARFFAALPPNMCVSNAHPFYSSCVFE